MSRKHFESFAREIAAMADREKAQACADMVVSVSLQHNGNFNPYRFLKACGLAD